MISRRRLFALGGAAAVAPMLPNVAPLASGGFVTVEDALRLRAMDDFTPIPSFEAYRRRRIEDAFNSPAMRAFMKEQEDRILYGDPNESHPFEGFRNAAVDRPTPDE